MLRGESATSHLSLAALATVSDANDKLPAVRNLYDWLQSAFVETDHPENGRGRGHVTHFQF